MLNSALLKLVDDEESKQKSIECDKGGGDSPRGAPVHQWVLQNFQHNDAKHISEQ
jgi:hypothetical protein